MKMTFGLNKCIILVVKQMNFIAHDITKNRIFKFNMNYSTNTNQYTYYWTLRTYYC